MDEPMVEGQTSIVSTGTEEPVEEKKKWWDQPIIIMGLVLVFVMILVGLIAGLS